MEIIMLPQSKSNGRNSMKASINPQRYVKEVCDKADLSKQEYDFPVTFTAPRTDKPCNIKAELSVHQYVVKHALCKTVQITVTKEKVTDDSGREVWLDCGMVDVEEACEKILTKRINGEAKAQSV